MEDRYYYAQINDSGICTGVVDTDREIPQPYMIPIESADKSYMGRTYADGEWQ